MTYGDILKMKIKEENFDRNNLKVLQAKKVNSSIEEYLINILSNLYIEITSKYEGSFIELLKRGKFEGWCWQTTEAAIVFFNDDDYIERGNLNLNERNTEYYHSWICFKYENDEYVFDPCLMIVCLKEEYHNTLEANVLGKVTAKNVREEVIRQINNYHNSDKEKEKYSFITSFFGDEYYQKYKNEVVMHGPKDVNAALYRNGCGYTTEIEDNKIKRLKVHYYRNDY